MNTTNQKAQIEKVLEAMRVDKAIRRVICRRSFRFFFLLYFNHYLDFPAAPFHQEIIDIAQNDTHSMFVLSAFRGSGKSTILSLAYAAWCVVNGRSKFTLIVSENTQKVQALLGHIREELEKDGLLKRDLGPFKEDRVAWNAVSLTVERYGAKITAVSTEQSVRGLRHGNHRPDLIILDDCESGDSVRTQESRDKLSRWLSGDVIPAGHSNTRVIVIGSILHPDSLIPRLQKDIDEGRIDGIYRMYPILDENGNPTWPARFSDEGSIEREKKRGVSERDWIIEYLLKPVVEEDQIIKPSDIHYYSDPPIPTPDTVHIGVDLAFTENAGDYTAIVAGVVTWEGDEWYLDILPNPVNVRRTGTDVVELILSESHRLGGGQHVSVYVENNGAQNATFTYLTDRGMPATGVSPRGRNKRARLNSAASYIKLRVRFPHEGAELLLNQLQFFGIERHDDLVDALVYLVLEVEKKMEQDRLHLVSSSEEKAKPMSQKEGEDWADRGKRLLQEAIRSQDATKWQEYADWQRENKKRSPEYIQEAQRFNAEMRRYTGR